MRPAGRAAVRDEAGAHPHPVELIASEAQVEALERALARERARIRAGDAIVSPQEITKNGKAGDRG